MDDTEYRPGRFGKAVALIFKIFIVAIVLFFYCFLTFRSCIQRDTGLMKKFVWNGEAIAEYNRSPDNFAVYELNNYNTAELSNIFTVSSVRYAENIGQFQFTVRYNNSVLDDIKEVYGVDTLPEGELFVFALTDNNGKYYTDYEYITDSRFFYTYRRLVFTGIDLTDVSSLTLIAFCTLDEEYSASDICDSVDIYYADDAKKPYKLKDSELFNEDSASGGLYEISFDIKRDSEENTDKITETEYNENSDGTGNTAERGED